MSKDIVYDRNRRVARLQDEFGTDVDALLKHAEYIRESSRILMTCSRP